VQGLRLTYGETAVTIGSDAANLTVAELALRAGEGIRRVDLKRSK